MSDDRNGMSGRDLQESQSGGGSGDFGGNRYQQQETGEPRGESEPAPVSNATGSSGSGGYGDMQNQQNHQGQGEGQAGLVGSDLRQSGGSSQGQSRGERFDEEQGGGRGGSPLFEGGEDQGSSGLISGEAGDQATSEFERDQREHQDRGQSEIGRDGES